MRIEPKSWIWKLTGPFASDNYTVVGETIYYPKQYGPPTGSALKHELVHIEQMKRVGTFRFLFLYLFCLPFLWNPWRWKWEMEAFVDGSGITSWIAAKKLRSKEYGWLL